MWNRIFRSLVVVLVWVLPLTAQSPASPHPKVRAITAFVQVDRDHYQAQMDEAISFLKAAKQDYTAAGWDVQTVRVSTQPFPQYTRGLSKAEAVKLLLEMDAYAAKAGVDFNIGPAVMHIGDPLESFDVLGEVLSQAKVANATALIVNEEGINWPAIKASARMLKYVSENSPHSQGTFNFAATAMVRPGTPFYPGSYHLGPGHEFAVGLQGASMVAEAFAKTGYDPPRATTALQEVLNRELPQAEAVAQRIATRSSWKYIGMDTTPPPLMDVSIGAAIESFVGNRFGSSGTLTAAGIITEAVKAAPVKQTGYAGLMLPVLEDKRLAQRWSEGAITIDSLLAYSAVCSTGLDTVPLPGDVTEEQLAKIYGDMATLAFKWKKQLTARLQPVKGKHAGEMTEFDDPFLVNAKLQALP
jgi:hypothetical protein